MNQRLLLFVFVVFSMAGMTSCKKDGGINDASVTPTSEVANGRSTPGTCLLEGTEIKSADLPAEITNYVQANFPNEKIDDAAIFDDNGTITYEVELENETILILDANGNLLAEGKDTDLPTADIPQVIQDAIAADYPSETIEEGEKEWTHTGQEVIKVELVSGQELLYDLNGTFLCSDTETDSSDGTNDNDDEKDGDNDNSNDGDDDNDDDDDIEIPAELQVLVDAYLATNFEGYTLKDGDLDTLCNGTPAVEAVLVDVDSNEIHAYFALDLNITLLQTETEITAQDLPTTLTDALAANYAAYTLETEAYRIELADGTVQYEVELKNTTTNAEITLILTADGTLVCEEE